MKTFKLKIVTPRGVYKETDIEMLNLCTTAGQIGILAQHIPLASGIEISEMNYIQDGNKYYFAIAGGFVYVNESETIIIANAIESPEEIDLHRAEKSKQRAEERISSQTDIDVFRAEISLRRALNRIHVKNGN